MKSKQQICQEFGTRIKELREKRNLTQKELADLVGIHVSFMGDLERGKKACGIEIAYWISEALEVRLYELFLQDHYPKEIIDFMIWCRENKDLSLQSLLHEITTSLQVKNDGFSRKIVDGQLEESDRPQ